MEFSPRKDHPKDKRDTRPYPKFSQLESLSPHSNFLRSFEATMNITVYNPPLPKPLVLSYLSPISNTRKRKRNTRYFSPLSLNKSKVLAQPNSYTASLQEERSQYNRSALSVSEIEEFPISGSQALRRYKDYLTYREKEEILGYDKVWFLGINAEKMIGKSYDDKGGDYHIVIGDHLLYRYEVIDILGKGSYGTVCKCKDHKQQSVIAIKIFKNKSYIRSQGLNEIQILRTLGDKDKTHSSVLKLYETFEFRGHLCMCLELLSMSLYSLMKNNSFQGLSIGIVRKFAHQILLGLKFLRKNRVIHADLKPDNIMVVDSKQSLLKLIDFDSACLGDNKIFTYIQTRYYRAPEIILSLPYDCAIDMWSFGCIIVELLTGSPLFQAKDELDLLSMIVEVRGLPPIEYAIQSPKYKTFFDSQGNPRHTKDLYGIPRKSKGRPLLDCIPTSDLRLLDLLYRNI